MLIFKIRREKCHFTSRLKKGTKINPRANSELHPLNSATGYGQLDVVKELLSRKANIDDQENRFGDTALMTAVIWDKQDCVKAVLNYQKQ